MPGVTIITIIVIILVLGITGWVIRIRKHNQMLRRIINTLNIQQFIKEWEETRRVLGSSFSLTLTALLGSNSKHTLPDYIVEPQHYDSFVLGINSGLNPSIVRQAVKLLAIPEVEYLANGIVNDLTLLVVTYRRQQLTIRELKFNSQHGEETQEILKRLNQNLKIVRAHLHGLLEHYASQTQNPTWFQDIKMHKYDMSDFYDRLGKTHTTVFCGNEVIKCSSENDTLYSRDIE